MTTNTAHTLKNFSCSFSNYLKSLFDRTVLPYSFLTKKCNTTINGQSTFGDILWIWAYL